MVTLKANQVKAGEIEGSNILCGEEAEEKGKADEDILLPLLWSLRSVTYTLEEADQRAFTAIEALMPESDAKWVIWRKAWPVPGKVKAGMQW